MVYKYIRCFDCGDYKEAHEIQVGDQTLYECHCDECYSTTRSTEVERTIDLDKCNEGLRRGYTGGIPGERCEHCKKVYGKEGHDACLGTLMGVMNACCGHGDVKGAYIQFLDGNTIYGEDAIVVQNVLKKYSK